MPSLIITSYAILLISLGGFLFSLKGNGKGVDLEDRACLGVRRIGRRGRKRSYKQDVIYERRLNKKEKQKEKSLNIRVQIILHHLFHQNLK